MVEEIAVRVKQIRNKLKLSQRALAKLIGSSHISIFKWEKGKSKPHPMFMKKIEELNEEDNCGHTCV